MFLVMMSTTFISSLASARALLMSDRVTIPITSLSSITGAPSISFDAKTLAASLIVSKPSRVIKFGVATSMTLLLGMLRIPVVSNRRMLSMSSLPTITPSTTSLLSGVGPTRILSPKSSVLIFPTALMAASHSPGWGMLVNSILATVMSFISLPSL